MSASACEVISTNARGFEYPECSVRAVRAALASDVHGIVLPLVLSRDLRWMVPLSGVDEPAITRIHSHLASRLVRDALPAEHLLSLYSAHGAGKTLYLEVKDRGEHRVLLRMLRAHAIDPIIIAWQEETLDAYRKADPSLRLGLARPPYPADRVIHHARPRSKTMLAYAPNERFDSWLTRTDAFLPEMRVHSLHVPLLACGKTLLRSAHERGIKVLAYGVNTRVAAALARRQGVDGFFTDVPLSLI